MAAACRALEPVWLRASWPPLYAGRTGSGYPCYCFPFGAKRYLLTESIVKLEEFQHKKMVIAYNLSDTKEAYFKHLEEKLTQNKLILKEELRKLLYLCQSQDDVEFAKNVIYRYHAENRNFTVGEYKFGPIFMRLCYALDLEESAMALIKDKHLRGFFVESTSFNILMDMLFVKGKYESAVELLFEMQSQDVRFTKDSYILAFAICYKLNTPESLKICTTLREESLSKGNFIPRRASHFAVALALNQNQLEEAMTIFSQISVPESITCTNLNIIIHIQSNMLENLMKILQDAANENSSNFVQKRMFSEEVLTRVKEKVKDNPTLLARFDEIYEKLHLNGQLIPCTLDALLCHIPRDRKSNTLLLRKKTISHRTLQLLGQTQTSK